MAKVTLGAGQSGLVLVFSLVFLLLLALMTTAIATSAQLLMRMVGLAESNGLSRQSALDEIELLLQQQVAVPPGNPGELSCRAGQRLGQCDNHDLPAGRSEAVSGWITVVESGGRPPPRLRESHATSAVAYHSARYEITAVAGQVSLTQGVLVLYPGAQQ